MTQFKMTTPQIIDALVARFGSSIQQVPAIDHPRVHVAPADWPQIAAWLRNEPAIQLDWLRCLTGIDYAADGQLAVAYELMSFTHRHDLAVKVYVSRDNPVIVSVAHLWPAANWHEREAFDLLGIVFEGHPNLQRILLADDWAGHPLRKDYEFPRSYHGIPGSVELDWVQK